MRKLFILFVLWLASSSASASVTLYSLLGIPQAGYWTTIAALCAAYPVGPGESQAGYNSQMCLMKTINDILAPHGSVQSSQYPDCPAGQAYQNGQKTCTPTGAVCKNPAGSVVTWIQSEGHAANPNAKVPDTDTPYPTSSATCGLQKAPDVTRCYTVASASGGKDFYCAYSGVSDGNNAPSSAPIDVTGKVPDSGTPTTTSTSADQSGKCPGGTVSAGMDSSGIPICVGAGTNAGSSSSSSSITSPTTTSTAADGTKTSTSSTSTTNSDGSTTTTTTTTITSPDGTVKTSQSTSTGTNAGGGQGKSEDAKDFCTSHPELTICQNSSVAGACGQTSCQGDAIQCATLRAAAAMQCAQQQDIDALKASPQKALGDQILAGNDPMAGQIADTLKGTSVDMSNVSFDQSGFLGGGTCLANRSFVVMGHAVPVDFTTICNNILPLRGVMMAVALILAYLIVGRSVVGS